MTEYRHAGESPIELMDFLLHHTPTHDLCVIRESGWILQVAYIDPEDLFLIHPRLQHLPVRSHSRGTLRVNVGDGQFADAPCHYVDV